jgi:hypothetical protein
LKHSFLTTLQDDITSNSTFEHPGPLPEPETVVKPSSHGDLQLHEDDSDDTLSEFESPETESNHLKMLESHSQASLKNRGEIS